MTDLEPSTETQDFQGSTVHYSGTVTSTASSIPSSANKIISEVFIRNTNAIVSVNLLVSFDNGVGFTTLKPYENIIWSPKGNQKQIKIKSSSGILSCSYESIINYEIY